MVTLDTMGKPKEQQDESKDQKNLTPNYYQLLAKLKGHRNSDPPSICYIPQSCCLVSGEKHLDELMPATAKGEAKNTGSYETYNQRGKDAEKPCEILTWNLQRDLIELFQSRPPWNVPFHKRINAHNASIIDMCYM